MSVLDCAWNLAGWYRAGANPVWRLEPPPPNHGGRKIEGRIREREEEKGKNKSPLLQILDSPPRYDFKNEDPVMRKIPRRT
jgi:hypothetical protein